MSENCKSLVVQDKCNIEIFLSPALLKSSEFSTKDFNCIFVHTEMHLIVFFGPSNCVNTQPYLGVCTVQRWLILYKNTCMEFLLNKKV